MYHNGFGFSFKREPTARLLWCARALSTKVGRKSGLKTKFRVVVYTEDLRICIAGREGTNFLEQKNYTTDLSPY